MTSVPDLCRLQKVRRRGRAVALLQRILAIRPLDIDALAEALVVSRGTLQDILSGRVPFPLQRQLCLALFVIEHVPELARQGHQLRGQVLAAIAFHEHATEVHGHVPPATRY